MTKRTVHAKDWLFWDMIVFILLTCSFWAKFIHKSVNIFALAS